MELISEDHQNIDELIKAQAHIWNHTFNFIKSMSLKSAIQLGIADAIHNHGKPITLSELVSALQVHPTKTHHLFRLMRVLVHSGFFSLKEEAYSLTPFSTLLRKNNPLNLRPFIHLILDPNFIEPYNWLSNWFHNNDPNPFVTAFGKSIFELAGHDDKFNSLVNEALASDSSLMAKIVTVKCKEVFEGLNSLVDVGGGIGIMAMAIAQTFPNLQCTVLDLPHVVADLKESKNLNFVGGDMFVAIPPADAILLKWLLCDWADEDCVKILKNCKEAISRQGNGGNKNNKVIIMDIVMQNQSEWTETHLFYDMAVMAGVNGYERNEKEWAKLFFDAGFSNYKIYPAVFGPRSLIEVYP